MLSRDEIIVYDRPNLLGFTKVPLTNTNKVSLVRPEFFNFSPFVSLSSFILCRLPMDMEKKYPSGCIIALFTHFTNYVDKILSFFDHLPKFKFKFKFILSTLLKLTFFNYPPLLVNIVCEQPLICFSFVFITDLSFSKRYVDQSCTL